MEGGAGGGGGGEFITGVAVPLLLALLLLDEEAEGEVVDMLEQEPMEQQEADELADDEELQEAGLNKLRSLLGVADPSLL